MTPQELIDETQCVYDSHGAVAAADALVEKLRSQKQFPELFEALKMKSRISMGVPAVAIPSDEKPSLEQQDQLERELLDACREVGVGLLNEGRLEEGWMYMRPVGDNQAAAAALANVEVTAENLDTLLHLYVNEGVDVGRGTRLSLDERGICNTITMLDSVVSSKGREDQQSAVGILVKTVHAELLESVQSDLQRRNLPGADLQSLTEILELNPKLLRDGGYHMDTTHIASTVRFSRVLDAQELLRLGLDMAVYGAHLHPNYQYPSDEPFPNLHASTATFIKVLLGEQIEEGLRVFRSRAEDLDVDQHGTIAIETYADLLSRIGRHEEAMKFLIRRMPPGARPFGIAPSMLELSREMDSYELMLEQSKLKGDIIGYAAALFHT